MRKMGGDLQHPPTLSRLEDATRYGEPVNCVAIDTIAGKEV